MPRTRGAKNLTADAVLRRDFLSTYRKLGGKKWLEQWARDNPVEFAKAMISKVTQPAAVKPTEPEQPAGGVLSDFEGARRIAFVMASAMHAAGEPLTVEGVEGEVVEPAPSWMPPADRGQPVVEPEGAEESKPVEQPALPAPEAKPERRSLADLLGFEPPPAVESLYGGFGQFHGSAEEQGAGRRDLIGDVRVVTRKETVSQKYRRMKGES